MSRKFKTQIGALASAALLVGSFAGPASADSVSVDVSNSRAQVIMNKQQQKSSDSSAPVNENRDASDSPVVQPVASMKDQTCIATGGVQVPCETDNEWFYAPKSCYASKEAKGPYYRKYHTAFECRPVGNNVSTLEQVSSKNVVMVPTSEADALATATKSGAQLAEDALADYDFEKLVVRTQPADASLRSVAFVFTQGYVWAWVPPSKARASSKRNPIVVESTDGDAHVQLKISFMAMNVHFDGQKTGTQGFIQCDDAGQIYAGEPRGGSNCSWKAKKQDVYQVRSSILYRVEWTAGDESGVLIHEEPMDGTQLIRVQDGYAVNVK
ncbi:hypothetical protein [Rothia mucilaginosa]|uniref:hypothetical protein n=1 Tax=Rothia mucilaginosa TaxID=43675 RepID=UPI0026F18F10|nr:hypothetical protein [Rothia mucilaginosa]